VKEAFGDSVSILKLGMVNPLPEKLILDFASGEGACCRRGDGSDHRESLQKARHFDVIGKDSPDGRRVLTESGSRGAREKTVEGKSD
jgi:hypothetical protein